MIRNGILWLSGILIIMILDVLWIGVLSSGIYKNALKPWLRMDGDTLSPHIPSVLALYALLSLGLIVFVLPHFTGGNFLQCVLLGGLFTGIVYGVYEFTNYALLKNWPLLIVGIDIAWGIVVGAVSTACLLLVKKMFNL